MKPAVKKGLTVGGITLVVIIPISILFGLCGPFVSLLAGGIAGFWTAYAGGISTRKEGGQEGAIAGAVTGGITLIGQIIGGLLVLAYVHNMGTPTLVGTAPSPGSPMGEIAIYYASGLAAGLCFGVIGIALSAIAGAAAGTLGTKEPPSTIPTFPQN